MLPLRKKVLRFSNSPFMSKSLRKAIMYRSKLKNIINKKRADANSSNCKNNGTFVSRYFGELRKTIFKI